MDIGIGTTSFTSGRLIPALNLVMDFSDYSFSFSSTGSASKLTYFSGYTASIYQRDKVGDLWGGDVEAGVGIGIYYTIRGYRETTSDEVEQGTDQGLGPGFRIAWFFFEPAYLSLEAFYGITTKPANVLVLSTQDIVIFTIGLRF